MRILVNMPSQYGGRHSGVARVAFSLLSRLLELTPHSYVLRSPWSRNQLPPDLSASRLEVIVTPRPRIMVFDVVRQALIMPILCRRLGVDTVLNIDPFGTPTGGKQRLTIVHDLYFKTIPDQVGKRATMTTDFIFKLIIAGSSKLVCVSEATRSDLASFYVGTQAKSVAIHSDSTLDVGALDIDSEPPVAGRYILAVGNATSNKNFGTLAQAFAQFAPIQSDLKLVHVGRDEGEEILSALPPAMHDRLIRREGLSDAELATLYRHAACLCVPSIYEGFCLPVLEAQELGCPVICADRSATPEIAGDGALKFDPTDAAALVAAFERFFSEPGLAQSLSEKGRQNRKRFSWHKAAKAYAALFGAS